MSEATKDQKTFVLCGGEFKDTLGATVWKNQIDKGSIDLYYL